MIAYIFWHAAPDGFSLETYEATLLKFGTSLANARISGVLGNASYAVSHTPWLGQGGYEDWTLLDGSSVLDRLNDQATTGCMEESHHAIAQITKHGGLGALYRLVDGAPDLSNDSAIIWLSRPRGVKWREALASHMWACEAESDRLAQADGARPGEGVRHSRAAGPGPRHSSRLGIIHRAAALAGATVATAHCRGESRAAGVAHPGTRRRSDEHHESA